MGTLVVANNVVDSLSNTFVECRMSLDTIACKVEKFGDNVNGCSASIDSCCSVMKQMLEQEQETFLCMPSQTAGIVISSLLTIVIFILGILIRNRTEKRRKRDKYNSIKQTFKITIENSKTNIERQITSIKEFTEALSTSNAINPPALKTGVLGIERLNEFSLNELTLTFVVNQQGDKNINEKLLSEVMDRILYFSKVLDVIGENYAEFRRMTIDLMEDWENGEKDAQKAFRDFFEKYKKSNGFHEFARKLIQIKKNDCSTHKEMVEKYYIPICEQLKDFVNEENFCDIAALSSTATNMIDTYKKKENLFCANVAWFNTYAENMKESLSELEKQFSELNSNELVKVCKIQ